MITKEKQKREKRERRDPNKKENFIRTLIRNIYIYIHAVYIVYIINAHNKLIFNLLMIIPTSTIIYIIKCIF